MPYVKKLVMHGFKSFPKKTELPFTPGINVILGPNGSGKSSSYDTLVTLATGEEIELGKLIEDKIKQSGKIKTLKDGIYVDGDNSLKIFSLNKESMKVESKTISKFIRREGDPLYKIVTATGKKVKATGCHPVMVFREGKVQSTIIKNLTKGDLVASPRKIDIQGEKFNPSISRLIGYIIGDGYIAKDRIEFINKDVEIIKDFKNIIKTNFNIPIKERYEKNATRLYIRNKEFLKYIRNYFEKSEGSITSKKKKIPSQLLKSDNVSVANLIAGLYDTDGSVRKDIAVIEFCTKNSKLANQLQGLLLRFGIISKIKKRVCCASNTNKKIKRDYFYVYVSGINNLQKFYQNIPLRINYKKQDIFNHLSSNIIPNQNIDLLPRETNNYIKELIELLGIKIKLCRKQYPLLAAYVENRCCPTRQGVLRVLNLCAQKLETINNVFNTMQIEQINLIGCMNALNISGQQASSQIGLHKSIIRRDWQTQRFNANPENLEKFYYFLQGVFLERMPKIQSLITMLFNLSTSDIFWDKITLIEKKETPKYVYDLTIGDNHNFIANNIFVHNSNVSDALCFVLGRLSIKSMRAAKAKNLIFLGTKEASPSKEAIVELVFDNTDKTFSLDASEVSIKRIVRKNGQSIYKINNETRTRQEVLALLAQAGIDPNGFNIILQGEIQNFVKMQTEERRKIIEEVSGISIYESRKEKSLKELDKTESRLKEVLAILRERTAYLNNLEKERQQALRFKKLEADVKKFKASIIYHDLMRKRKESENIQGEIQKKNKDIEKLKKLILTFKSNIANFESKISSINTTMQKSTGLEQEKLNQEIANLRADLAGLHVKQENTEKKLNSIIKQKQELQELIRENEVSIRELKKESPTIIQKEKELNAKKKELELLEEQRKKFYMTKSELKSIRERFEDKKSFLQNYNNESDFLIKQIESLTKELFDKHTTEKKLEELKFSLAEKKDLLDNLDKKEIEFEKLTHTNEYEIDKQKKIIENISKMDICPLCKSNITEEHIDSIKDETNPKIEQLSKEIDHSDKAISDIYNKRDILKQQIEQISNEINKREADLVKIGNINEKKDQIKFLREKIEKTKGEFEELSKRKKFLEDNFEENSNIEHKYETIRVEVQEISLRTEENVNSEISFKQREFERAKISLKQLSRDEEDLQEEIKILQKALKEKEELLEKKKQQDEELNKKFQKLIAERESFQNKIRENESFLSTKQNEVYNVEQKINNLKIEKARVDAEIENLEIEILEFPNIEIIKTNRESLTHKLHKTQQILSSIGSVNLRSLEVYDSIKKEYDVIKEKVDVIAKEKEGILRVIHQIDIQKKKAFLKTLTELNDIFSRNFAQISTKGQVSLELENKKDPFLGGVNIVVKTGHGKYFDVTSLSGGEQTMVALSLIFAIQEFKPYCFYILDEIDAALDKRNSERLASLLKKYMQKGQYIVITHNDEIITNATNLYGVSMHEGVSKVISMKI